MIAPKDGGSAFPVAACYDENASFANGVEFGMSLRDWFAGMALSGMMASVRPGFAYEKFSDASDNAYEYADAMIKSKELSQ
jgi:hypothetical protein